MANGVPLTVLITYKHNKKQVTELCCLASFVTLRSGEIR